MYDTFAFLQPIHHILTAWAMKIDRQVIHITGGTVALIAATILGPRVGRFYDTHGRPFRRPRDIPGQSVALQLLGTFLLWFGCKCFKRLALSLSNCTHNRAVDV
jgi:ammonia channel protein AmtB